MIRAGPADTDSYQRSTTASSQFSWVQLALERARVPAHYLFVLIQSDFCTVHDEMTASESPDELRRRSNIVNVPARIGAKRIPMLITDVTSVDVAG